MALRAELTDDEYESNGLPNEKPPRDRDPMEDMESMESKEGAGDTPPRSLRAGRLGL